MLVWGAGFRAVRSQCSEYPTYKEMHMINKAIQFYLRFQLHLTTWHARVAYYFARKTGAQHWYDARSTHQQHAGYYAMQLDQLEINK